MKFLKFSALGVLSLLLLWAAGLGAFAVTSLSAKPQEPEKVTDAIIVLTGGNGRIYEGLKLFADGRAPHLFITGVHEDVTMKDIISQWDGKHALPPCCITLGHKARSTVQNAEEVQEWLEGRNLYSIRLVTGNYHMPRAEMEIRQIPGDMTIYTHPIEQEDLKTNHELLRNLLVSEYHKTIYRFFVLLFTGKG